MEIGAMLDLQGMIFLLMLLAMFLRKKGIITDEGKNFLTDLVIMVTLPASIVKAFMGKTTPETLKNCFTSLWVATAAELISMALGHILFKRYPKTRRTVMEYATLGSNAGVLGSTVAEGLYAEEGLLYASVSLIPIRIFLWSVGLVYFTTAPSKKEVVKKVLTHPCIIAVFVGAAFMLTGIQLPKMLFNTLNAVANSNTAMATMMVGTCLAEVDWKHIFNKDLFIITFVRLFLVPALILAFGWLVGLRGIILGIPVILAAMPVANTTTILASKYKMDTEFATSAVVFTTICSMFTAPLWGLILNQF